MPFKFNPFTKKPDYYETGGGGSSSWGSITGNLQDQIDLKNELDSKADTNHNHNLADLSEKSYNSLTDKPTIPTKTSELTNDSGFISSESDPVWNSEKSGYYTKTQTDTLLDGKSDTGHTHTKSNITDLENITTTPTSNSIPKSDANGKIDNGWLKTGSGNGLDADTLDGQHASSFASASHNHDDRYYTETELSTSGGGGQVHWNNVTNKPSTYPPSSHTHLLADITNAGALASKNTISTNDVDNDAITYAKIQNVSTNNRFLGRVSSGAGDIEELTASQAKSILAISKSDISDFAHQSTHQSGGSDAITGNLDAVARTTVRKNSGTNTGSRRRLNFIEGSNVTITTTDDPTDEEIDITISAASGGITDGDKGDITVSGSGTTWTIDSKAVTYSKIQDVSATNRFLGRISTGSGQIEEITPTQATSMLDVFTSSTKGLVPASGGGTTNFLRADGSWAAPSGSGGGDNITVNGSAVTDADFDDSTPSAPAGGVNVKWQNDTSSPSNVSAYLPIGSSFIDALRYKPFYYTDFLGPAGAATIEAAYPFDFAVISSGTQAKIAGEANHPGILRISSSTTANSGGYVLTDATAFLLGGGECFELVFQHRVASGTNTTLRFGYLDTLTSADATDGVYFEIPANSLAISGKTASNSTRSTTGTSYTLTVNTWYRARLVVNSNATRVDFYLFDSTGTQIWTDYLTTNIPTGSGRNTGAGVVATNSGTTATLLVYLDWMAIWYDSRALTG